MTDNISCGVCNDTGRRKAEGVLDSMRGRKIKWPYYYCCDCQHGVQLKSDIVSKFEHRSSDNGTQKNGA